MYLSKNQIYKNIFDRQELYYSKEERLKIRNSKIALAGIGGIGGSVFEGLIRNGFSDINIADIDQYDITNYRQLYMDIETIGKDKVDVAYDRAKRINPYAKITKFSNGVNANNVFDFCKDADVICQESDLLSTSIMLNIVASELNIPVLHGSRDHWLNSHKLSVNINDYRKAEYKYSIDFQKIEEHWGVSRDLLKKLIKCIKNGYDSSEVEKLINDQNRDFRRKKVLELIECKDLRLEQFTLYKDIEYIKKISEDSPMMFDKKRISPEQAAIMGNMVVSIAKDIILDYPVKKLEISLH